MKSLRHLAGELTRQGHAVSAPTVGRRLRTRPLLSHADRLLITVVYLRQICTQCVLSDMLEINPNSISKAIAQTTRLLDQQRHTITATTGMPTRAARADVIR
jgi:hypothetical protein